MSPRAARNDKNEKIRSEFLLDLMDALIKEEYEECPKLIAAAREFGAGQHQIDEIVQGFARHDNYIPVEKLDVWI